MVASIDAPPLVKELTVNEAAEALGVSTKTVRRYLADGSLIARNAAPLASRRPMWRIPLDAVLELRGAYAVQATTRPAQPSATRLAPYTPRNFNLHD